MMISSSTIIPHANTVLEAVKERNIFLYLQDLQTYEEEIKASIQDAVQEGKGFTQLIIPTKYQIRLQMICTELGYTVNRFGTLFTIIWDD